MNMAFYYHDLPQIDDMLYAWAEDMNVSEIVPGWANSKIDFFIVIGVTDEQIRQLYANVKCRADSIVNSMRKRFIENKKEPCCDVKLKRLYRFDTAATANRFLSHLALFSEDDFDNDDYYEDFMRDRTTVWFHYEEPWKFARELTSKDWEKGGLFYEELHRSGICGIKSRQMGLNESISAFWLYLNRRAHCIVLRINWWYNP